MQVIKRDGRAVDFDDMKIITAINKANADVDVEERASAEEIKAIADSIRTLRCKRILIEDIQDKVEDALMKLGKCELARQYIIYRYKRMLVRKSNTTDETILTLVRGTNREVADENSNKNATLISTQRDLIAGEVSRDIANRLLLPEDVSKAHQAGEIHFHDADYALSPAFNCCLVNLEDMLQNGTVINGKMIEKPHSFSTACTIASQICAAVASSQFGGQSFNISHLAPFVDVSRQKFINELHDEYQALVEKELIAELPSDDTIKEIAESRVRKEVAKGVQTIQYQINTLMTTNGQSPFVTMFMWLDEEDPYIKDTAIVIEEVLRQRYQGIKNEAGVYITPAFPKLIYVLDENNNLTGGEYDYLTELAVKCSAKRMYPDYISAKIMRENYEGNVFTPMGCRSFLSPWKDKDGKYKFYSRFNKGVVSINLPRVALDAAGDETKFWEILNERLEMCHKALLWRHNNLVGTLSDVSPIHWQHGALARLKKGETIDELLTGGYSTLSLGYIGIYETTKLIKGVSHTDPDGTEFALKLMKYLRSRCEVWKEKSPLGWALYGSPAENLCYRFARLDKEKYGDIKDVTDKGYYTNSYHVDVREPITVFEKFAFEAPFQKISSGGAISYAEIPNMRHNIDALKELVKFIYDNIQYAEFNTKSDYCHNCGFDGEIVVNEDGEWECPACGNRDRSRLTVIRRTCGYLGENFWNVGKTKEISSRVLHI